MFNLAYTKKKKRPTNIFGYKTPRGIIPYEELDDDDDKYEGGVGYKDLLKSFQNSESQNTPTNLENDQPGEKINIEPPTGRSESGEIHIDPVKLEELRNINTKETKSELLPEEIQLNKLFVINEPTKIKADLNIPTNKSKDFHNDDEQAIPHKEKKEPEEEKTEVKKTVSHQPVFKLNENDFNIYDGSRYVNDLHVNIKTDMIDMINAGYKEYSKIYENSENDMDIIDDLTTQMFNYIKRLVEPGDIIGMTDRKIIGQALSSILNEYKNIEKIRDIVHRLHITFKNMITDDYREYYEVDDDKIAKEIKRIMDHMNDDETLNYPFTLHNPTEAIIDLVNKHKIDFEITIKLYKAILNDYIKWFKSSNTTSNKPLKDGVKNDYIKSVGSTPRLLRSNTKEDEEKFISIIKSYVKELANIPGYASFREIYYMFLGEK